VPNNGYQKVYKNLSSLLVKGRVHDFQCRL